MPQIQVSMPPRRRMSLDVIAVETAHIRLQHRSPSTANKRGPYQQAYSKDDLQHALTTYRSASRSRHPLSIEDAARPSHVPPATLRRYNRRVNEAIISSPRGADIAGVMETVINTTRSGNPHTLLNSETEALLLVWVTTMAEMTIPVDLDMLRLKAKRLQFATQNIALTDENLLDTASRHWWKALRRRHPELVLRVPEKLEWLRCRATQPEIINHFYSLLELYLTRYQYTPDQIWAADEVGVEGDNKLKKVVATRGQYTRKKHSCTDTHQVTNTTR
jgi:hypothetical protein